jgi:hypothetical protein
MVDNQWVVYLMYRDRAEHLPNEVVLYGRI